MIDFTFLYIISAWKGNNKMIIFLSLSLFPLLGEMFGIWTWLITGHVPLYKLSTVTIWLCMIMKKRTTITSSSPLEWIYFFFLCHLQNLPQMGVVSTDAHTYTMSYLLPNNHVTDITYLCYFFFFILLHFISNFFP